MHAACRREAILGSHAFRNRSCAKLAQRLRFTAYRVVADFPAVMRRMPRFGACVALQVGEELRADGAAIGTIGSANADQSFIFPEHVDPARVRRVVDERAGMKRHLYFRRLMALSLYVVLRCFLPREMLPSSFNLGARNSCPGCSDKLSSINYRRLAFQ